MKTRKHLSKKGKVRRGIFLTREARLDCYRGRGLYEEESNDGMGDWDPHPGVGIDFDYSYT